MHQNLQTFYFLFFSQKTQVLEGKSNFLRILPYEMNFSAILKRNYKMKIFTAFLLYRAIGNFHAKKSLNVELMIFSSIYQIRAENKIGATTVAVGLQILALSKLRAFQTLFSFPSSKRSSLAGSYAGRVVIWEKHFKAILSQTAKIQWKDLCKMQFDTT